MNEAHTKALASFDTAIADQDLSLIEARILAMIGKEFPTEASPEEILAALNEAFENPDEWVVFDSLSSPLLDLFHGNSFAMMFGLQPTPSEPPPRTRDWQEPSFHPVARQYAPAQVRRTQSREAARRLRRMQKDKSK